MKPKVFLTRELPPECMRLLTESTELSYNHEDRVLTKQEIISGVQNMDGLICLLTDTIDDEILAAGSKLQVVSNFAVGFNNIDVNAATRRQIPVTNTPRGFDQQHSRYGLGSDDGCSSAGDRRRPPRPLGAMVGLGTFAVTRA